jgi:AAA domain-containing protein
MPFERAIRDSTSIVTMLCGASGSGKTLSALKLARGMCGGDDSKIGFICTEAGRSKHYAPGPGEPPGPDKFSFNYRDLRAPFSSEAYLEAIKEAEEAGFAVVIVDSCSHEWEGDGGLHDLKNEIATKMVERQKKEAIERNWRFDEDLAYDKASVSAWGEAKEPHKKFVYRLLRMRAHLILCFRADEKMRIETVEQETQSGKKFRKTIFIAAKDMPPHERWQPICEKRFPYEMTISLLLTPDKPGVPIPIKLQAQHMPAFPQGKQISEASGKFLAEWASGGSLTCGSSSGDTSIILNATARESMLIRDAEGRAAAGMTAYRAFWDDLSAEEQMMLLPHHKRLKEVAHAADAVL